MHPYRCAHFQIYEYTPSQSKKIEKALFFAHANGVPAQTYRALFEKMAESLNWLIVTYDMRGIGKTKAPAKLIKDRPSEWIWDILIADHIELFQKIKKQKADDLIWIFGGHSLGAWISLLSAKSLQIDKLYLLDPPILPPKIILKWSLVSLLKLKHLSTLAKRVKKRKIKFSSIDNAFQEFKKSSFMKKWSDETILDYINGSFAENEDNIQLIHDPNWEGIMFEEYPATAAFGFLKLPFKLRNKLTPIFFVGENSDTCYPLAKKWVQLFFPKLTWVIIPKGTHMYPIEMPDELILTFQHHT
ncbi:alpha/beta fold hydrolase [Fluviispira vulneris]|uniref:alpha/beta fold hydrolase n=1 Tax=Fluviispira vulneris TaxID=2763012 RepID=UPI001648F165|nr:alpha/beta hydrolase [Fluviispira vulneris]